jgi:hypothetical protein
MASFQRPSILSLGDTKPPDMCGRPFIRVLELFPGQFEDDIVCELQTTRLDRRPQPPLYEALSYVWGDPKVTKDITINGQVFAATANLESALRHVRYPDASRTLWIDAICIDQENNEEKIGQIRIMREIYICCTGGLVWLGDPAKDGVGDDEVQQCFDLLDHVASVKPIPQELIDLEWYRKALWGVERMRTTAWWSRIWTVQEIILPSRAIVAWGRGSCLWSTLETAAAKLPRVSGMPDGLSRAEGHIRADLANQVVGVRLAQQVDSKIFLQTLWRLRHRQATDTRDKVFGLMGIIFGLEQSLIRVQECDYNTSKVALFSKLAVDLFEAQMDLTPLLGFTGTEQPTIGMPSWVHDWGEFQGDSICHSFWNHFHRNGWYTADKGNSGGYMVDEEYRKSHLDGHKVDIIVVVVDVDHIAPFWTNEVHIDQQLVKRLEAAVQSHYSFDQQYVDMEGVTYADAFWKTMVGDLICSQSGMPPIRWADSDDKLRFEQFMGEGCHTGSWDYNCASIQANIAGHTLFLTSQGFLGVGPKFTKVGDEVWILYEGHTPFTLRPYGREDLHYSLVGDCYMHGVMRGENSEHENRVQNRETAIIH